MIRPARLYATLAPFRNKRFTATGTAQLSGRLSIQLWLLAYVATCSLSPSGGFPMNTLARNGLMSALTIAAVASQMCTPVLAQSVYHGYVNHQPTTKMKVRSFMYRHPKVKAATIGGGVGTAAGAVAGLVSGRGIMRGALIGAGTGAGVGLIRSSRTLAYHPVVKDTATGVATGLGLGMAAGHGHHSGVKGAAVGGAVGLGLGALRQVW